MKHACGLLSRGASVCFVVALLLLLMAAPAAALAFTDVPANHPNAVAINDLAARGIIGGYSNGAFGPGDPVIRQQFAKMIVLGMRLPRSEADVCPFSDVAPAGGTDPLYPDNYVAVAAGRGITQGTGPTTFLPWDNISRAQVITMVMRAVEAEWPGLVADPPYGYVSTWDRAFDPVHGPNARRAEYNGLLAGLPLVTLDPWGAMPRAEVAQVLYNLLNLIENGRSGDLYFCFLDSVSNMSAFSGHKFAGPVTTWPIIGGQDARAGLAGMAYGGDLLALITPLMSGPVGPVQNVSQATGKKILGPVRAWVSQGMLSTSFSLGATGRDGHLYDFFQTGGGWGVVDVSDSAGGVTVLGPPAPLPQANFDQYAALSPEGDLLLFHLFHMAWKWNVTNISAELGMKIAGPVTGFQTGLGPPFTDYVAAVDRTGDLLLFHSSGSKWSVQDLSSQTGYRLRMWSVGSWADSTGAGWEIELAGVTTSGDLILFRSLDGAQTWQATNLTQQTGAKATTPAEVCRYTFGTEAHDVVVAGGDARALTIWSTAAPTGWRATVWKMPPGDKPLLLCGPPSARTIGINQGLEVPMIAGVGTAASQ